jgi:hypothetical protein
LTVLEQQPYPAQAAPVTADITNVNSMEGASRGLTKTSQEHIPQNMEMMSPPKMSR